MEPPISNYSKMIWGSYYMLCFPTASDWLQQFNLYLNYKLDDIDLQCKTSPRLLDISLQNQPISTELWSRNAHNRAIDINSTHEWLQFVAMDIPRFLNLYHSYSGFGVSIQQVLQCMSNNKQKKKYATSDSSFPSKRLQTLEGLN